jgi:hypothetical protein
MVHPDLLLHPYLQSTEGREPREDAMEKRYPTTYYSVYRRLMVAWIAASLADTCQKRSRCRIGGLTLSAIGMFYIL